jgi:hypothetical protein
MHAQEVSVKLARKVLLYESESGETYLLRFGNKAITWQCLAGPNAGSSRTVFYDTVEIAPKQHFVSWLDTNNEAVRMIANLKKKIIHYNYVNQGIRHFSKGKIRYFGPPVYANGDRIRKVVNRILFRKVNHGI